MPNFLKDMEIDEVSLVDEPATGKRFSFFKCQSEKCKAGIKRVLGKQDEEKKPASAREDLYMIEDPVELEEEGSWRVFVGFGQGKEAPSDEDLKVFCEQEFKEREIADKIYEVLFNAPSQEDSEATYIEGIVWTVERAEAAAPAEPGAMGGGFTGTTGAGVSGGAPIPTGGEAAPVGAAEAGEIQTRKQDSGEEKKEHEPVDRIKQMRRRLRNATAFLDMEHNEKALEELKNLREMPEFESTGHQSYLDSLFQGDYRRSDIRDFIRAFDVYLDQQQAWNPETGNVISFKPLRKGFSIASLENDPEALDYAMVLADEFSVNGVLDDYAQIEIFEMVKARFGRKVSRFRKFIEDFKWWILGSALAYIILKDGTIMKAELMTEEEAEIFMVLDTLGGPATFERVMQQMGVTMSPERVKIVMEDLAQKNYVAITGNGTLEYTIRHEYMKRGRTMRLQNPIQKEQGYQGWTNYETWNIVLWVGNEEGPYNTMVAHRPYTAETARNVAEWLYPMGTPDMDSEKDFDKVNWQEVAEAWNEDGEEEDEGIDPDSQFGVGA